jgi:hypothetical protein
MKPETANRIWEEVLGPFIESQNDIVHCFEPRVGGCDFLTQCPYDNNTVKLYATDETPILLDLFASLQAGWIPPKDITHQEWDERKQAEELTTLDVWTGFAGSSDPCFFGKWGGRSRVRQSYMWWQKNLPLIKRTQFLPNCAQLEDVEPCGYLVFCRCPKEGKRAFWKCMRQWSLSNTVYVFGSRAPRDFRCVWQGASRREKVFSSTCFAPPRKPGVPSPTISFAFAQ